MSQNPEYKICAIQPDPITTYLQDGCQANFHEQGFILDIAKSVPIEYAKIGTFVLLGNIVHLRYVECHFMNGKPESQRVVYESMSMKDYGERSNIGIVAENAKVLRGNADILYKRKIETQLDVL